MFYVYCFPRLSVDRRSFEDESRSFPSLSIDLLTSTKQIRERLNDIDPHIMCQQCVGEGTFTPSKPLSTEPYLCRIEKCGGWLFSAGMLGLIGGGLFKYGGNIELSLSTLLVLKKQTYPQCRSAKKTVLSQPGRNILLRHVKMRSLNSYTIWMWSRMMESSKLCFPRVSVRQRM